ncbi:NAD-dependent epimerase/dehydratase family protein [Bordetella genomosp. 5]|uniref:NAD(P)-dependent oxidoreductase n=1 Tax=Bordetella genomosp. 5 TaxID=1395608 RepID=A0A261U011_9BORD|nr:NAD-dependent epimerase/dehydratase family protein [Bordetella genomosp. 5]OZI54570.1 NAD(P)-dependent oxidoreductase [Bordetella genomosp. 5]
MTERILLAGCGDLGMRAAQRLIARGDEVWALRRNPPAGAPAGIRWIAADLADPASLAQLPKGISRVAYLPTPGGREPERYRAVFIDGLANLLAALDAAALERVLFVSSSAVYGGHDGEWIDETTPEAPQGFNGRILLEAETWLHAQPFETVSLRLSGLYGPGRVQLLQRLRAGSAAAPRTPPHWANRIHIDDAAAAVAHLLHLPQVQPCYLGADDTPLPLDVLYAHLAQLLGAPVPPDGPAPAGVGSKRMSNARLRASGLTLAWPDSREGYRALIDAGA